jgi:cell division protein FtsI (penicillin-binding protein 3)
LRIEQSPIARRVIESATAGAVLSMLEKVVSPEGTGQQAAVAGYRVGGKTGTVKKFAPGGYSDSRYTALFSGIAPLSQPRLAVVVIIDEPTGGRYYGGQVAAPVFSKVVAGALRILAIPPDHFPQSDALETTLTANVR